MTQPAPGSSPPALAVTPSPIETFSALLIGIPQRKELLQSSFSASHPLPLLPVESPTLQWRQLQCRTRGARFFFLLPPLSKVTRQPLFALFPLLSPPSPTFSPFSNHRLIPRIDRAQEPQPRRTAQHCPARHHVPPGTHSSISHLREYLLPAKPAPNAHHPRSQDAPDIRAAGAEARSGDFESPEGPADLETAQRGSIPRPSASDLVTPPTFR